MYVFSIVQFKLGSRKVMVKEVFMEEKLCFYFETL